MTISVLRLQDSQQLDQAWGHIKWMASGALNNSSLMTLGLATILQGQTNPLHRHPNCEEVLHLLSGKIRHRLGTKEYVLNAGDTITIPAGTWHNATAFNESNATMIICFSNPERLTEFASELELRTLL